MSEWDDLQRIFERVIAAAPEDRARVLDESTIGCEELRRDVAALIEAHERDETLLEVPAGEIALGTMPVFPGYRVVREIGRGGMGTVYEAEREHPRRRVALKIVHGASHSRSRQRRFEHEVRLLARLHHPGIAQILDAGVASSAQGDIPYLTMELVRGRSLAELVYDPSMEYRERMELVARIADAVQHAHQNGVIHRDLKPANIIVTPEGQPKILDFGVARAIDPEGDLTTLRTREGQLVGTLAYMSPEQAGGDPSRIDTRSDVYALGVVAFELLCGRLPYDLRGKLAHETMRTIQHEEATRLSSISRAYRGDAETIIAKALEKDRARRYQSASEFASDIRRHLADEPIIARPPSRAYLASKFVRRHRPLVIGASLVALAVTLGAFVSTALALRLSRTNDALTRSLDDLEVARGEAVAQAGAAERRARTAERVNAFFIGHLLFGAAPEQTLGREVTLREALDATASSVDAELSGEPEAAAFIHSALASVFQHLGEQDRVLPHSERALALFQRELGLSDRTTINAMNNHTQYLRDANRLEESDALRERTIRASRDALGERDPLTLAVLTGHASDLMGAGDFASAIPLLERTLAAMPEDEVIESRIDRRLLLAGAYQEVGRIEHAREIIAQALADARANLPRDHPQELKALNALGAVLMASGDAQAALPTTREIADAAVRVLGASHVNALIARQNLARNLAAVGRFAEGERLWLEVIPALEAQLPEHHPLAGLVNKAFGIALAENQRERDALPYLVRAFEHFEATLGGRHPEAQQGVRWLIEVHERLGEHDAAETWRARRVGDE